MSTAEDKVELHENGGATLAFDGRTIRLRRPRIGEWRKLRQSLWDLQDEETRLRAGLSAAPKSDEPEARAEWRSGLRSVNDQIEDQVCAWVCECVDVLGDGELPDQAELPGWFTNPGLVAELSRHFTRLPNLNGLVAG